MSARFGVPGGTADRRRGGAPGGCADSGQADEQADPETDQQAAEANR